MGIAANAGKVYGVWARTAQPDEFPSPPAAKDVPSAKEAPKDDVDKDEIKKDEPQKDEPKKAEAAVEQKLAPKLKGLVIEIGLADFSASK
jgi:hypothetical protein